jgi:hypothetical protein
MIQRSSRFEKSPDGFLAVIEGIKYATPGIHRGAYKRGNFAWRANPFGI